VACRRLGLTQLTVGQAGFGCYRVSAGAAHHEKALRRALREGINLIDTSTNYADGGSESLTCVLVGMRRKAYVFDVIAELQRPVQQASRFESWQKLTEELIKTLD
jgi:aryl-alcohol dehydrogenase-like predicted oxidoreductase